MLDSGPPRFARWPVLGSLSSTHTHTHTLEHAEAKHEIDEKTQSLLTDAYGHAAQYLRPGGHVWIWVVFVNMLR